MEGGGYLAPATLRLSSFPGDSEAFGFSGTPGAFCGPVIGFQKTGFIRVGGFSVCEVMVLSERFGASRDTFRSSGEMEIPHLPQLRRF